MQCLRCNNKTSRKEVFLGIQVEMYTEQPSSKQPPSKQSRKNLQDKLSNMYNTAELLMGDNGYHCQTCGALQDAANELRLSESGRCLVVTLTVKIFHINGKGESKKVQILLSTMLHCPFHILTSTTHYLPFSSTTWALYCPFALPILDYDIYYTLFALVFHYVGIILPISSPATHGSLLTTKISARWSTRQSIQEHVNIGALGPLGCIHIQLRIWWQLVPPGFLQHHRALSAR